jgi:hypothetical protein
MGIDLITRSLNRIFIEALKGLRNGADGFTFGHFRDNRGHLPLKVQSIVEYHISIPHGLNVARSGRIQVRVNTLGYNAVNLRALARYLPDQIGNHACSGRNSI